MGTFYTGATGIGSGPHLDFRIYDVAAGDYVNPSGFTDVLSVGGKPLVDQFRMTSGFGKRDAPVPGASTMHKGLDYATPEGTAIDVVGGKFLTTFPDEKGGRMSQYALRRDGKDYDVLLLHGSDKNPILSDAAKTDFDYSTLGTENLRSSAKEKAIAFKNKPSVVETITEQPVVAPSEPTAKSIVEGFGNNFDAMKSSRLGDALRGAQENIVQKRMK